MIKLINKLLYCYRKHVANTIGFNFKHKRKIFELNYNLTIEYNYNSKVTYSYVKFYLTNDCFLDSYGEKHCINLNKIDKNNLIEVLKQNKKLSQSFEYLYKFCGRE